MKITNFEEMKKVCDARGQDVYEYIQEVDAYAKENGQFNDPILYYSNSKGYSDMFFLEKDAKVRFVLGDLDQVVPWNVNRKELDEYGWKQGEVVVEPEYSFYGKA